MSIMIDEVLSDIDVPVGNTDQGEPARTDAPEASEGGGNAALRDTIIRLEKRELRLTAD